MSKSSSLVLFTQVPLNSKFRFETPDEGRVFIKVSDTAASHDGAVQPVNPGVLVFLVPNSIIIAEFIQKDGTKRQALEVLGRWVLVGNEEGYSDQYFHTLEDVINHLESA